MIKNSQNYYENHSRREPDKLRRQKRKLAREPDHKRFNDINNLQKEIL